METQISNNFVMKEADGEEVAVEEGLAQAK